MVARDAKSTAELGSIRDTVEGIWVAIVLAFVLRGFLIEAFVIPTGSMAPRLMGEHWDVQCPACGWRFPYGVSRYYVQSDAYARGKRSTPAEAQCPNCGYDYPAALAPIYPNGGDRVLVLKYLYQFREPEPWDVVVFRNPQDDRQNYIKRLVGLPGETIEIVHGDVFVSDDGGETFRIRTKPPQAQNAMWQVVFDNDFHPDESKFAGRRPPEWTGPGGGWDLAGHFGRLFRFEGGERREVRFEAVRDAFLPHYGYNPPRAEDLDDRRDVVTDLKLSCTFTPDSPDARLGLELSSFDHAFRGEVSAGGEVRLQHRRIDGAEGWTDSVPPRSLEPIPPGRGVETALFHVDLGVELWVGGVKALEFRGPEYPEDYESIKERMQQVAARPVPEPRVRLTGTGGSFDVRHVQLYRDVFYTWRPLENLKDRPEYDYARRLAIDVDSRRAGWGTTAHPIHLERHGSGSRDLDEFFVLGDNSPQSLDGRSWTAAAPTLRLWKKDGRMLDAWQRGAEPVYKLGTVPRYALIGRALFVYWPAGFRAPGLPWLPIIPNVGRMRLIR